MNKLIWVLPGLLLLSACAPIPDEIIKDNIDRYIEICKTNEGLSKFYPETWASSAKVYCRNGAIFYFHGKEVLFFGSVNEQ